MKLVDNTKNYPLPYIAKGKLRFKILIFLIALCVIAEMVVLVIHELNSGSVIYFGSHVIYNSIFIAVLIFIYLYIASYEIVVSEHTISCNHFFSKKWLSISSITKMEIVIEGLDRYKRKKSLFLALYDDGDFSQDPFRVDIAPFRKEDLTAIVNIIFNKNPSVKIDEHIRQLKEGYMGSIFMEIINRII